MSTSGTFRPPALSGIAYKPTEVFELTEPGVWVATGLEVTLPEAGTYLLDADIRSSLTATPPCNLAIHGRLFNVTANTPLADSARVCNQVVDTTSSGAGSHGRNETAPISEWVTVTGPTTIRFEALRVDLSGTPTTARIVSATNGRCSLRWLRA